jgi:hypothetical protein
MKDDKVILGQLDGGFDKTKLLVTKTLGKLDNLVTKGSNSICCYVILFTIMILAIVLKLS